MGLVAAPTGAQPIPTMPTEAPQSSFDQQFNQATATNPLNVTSGPAFGGQDYFSPARRAKLAREREAKAAAKAVAAKPPAQ